MTTITAPGHRLMSTEETAEFLGVPRQTLAVWRVRQQGPAYVKVGRYVKYRLSAVEAWIDTQTHGGDAA